MHATLQLAFKNILKPFIPRSRTVMCVTDTFQNYLQYKSIIWRDRKVAPFCACVSCPKTVPYHSEPRSDLPCLHEVAHLKAEVYGATKN